jgi:hypothetical protein
MPPDTQLWLAAGLLLFTVLGFGAGLYLPSTKRPAVDDYDMLLLVSVCLAVGASANSAWHHSWWWAYGLLAVAFICFGAWRGRGETIDS